ncbi:MAG: DEAD/DEAH box helicase, partial [Synergistaceae bacterium]|nr:DEAD/DEAH box helicase [Synergistaceae bacterium]
KIGFAERIIISVADNWNKNAEDAIQNQQIPCTRLTLEAMERSSIDWSRFELENLDSVNYIQPKKLRDDQNEALNAVIDGFKTHDRGKLIMACGTGKTFTSLKIAEKIAGTGKNVIVLVPSIALLNQTLLAWNIDNDVPLLSFAVCSDSTVGHKDVQNEDMKITDLACPATTKPDDLIRSWNAVSAEIKSQSMTVVFSTYQSLPVISKAQEKGLPDFDLVICDEAHRTTGVTLKDEEDSNFTKIHKNEYIRAAKRLYMTATPRLFKASQARKAAEVGAVLCSMDDEKIYGPEFYRLSFSKAVELGLLSDYKVMILAVDEAFVSDSITPAMRGGEFKLDDAAKIIGCWKGLSKQLAAADDYNFISADTAPMRSAVAFSSTIKNSKLFRDNFGRIVDSFKFNNKFNNNKPLLNCEVRHVDGQDSVLFRNTQLAWLKEAADGTENTECRILSNARCLSEGVDIPALDAILFLNPRKSDIDIVQSVGRVMRRAANKKFGYVILPVVIPGGVSPDEALDKNENYKVVWQVLQALRAHDDNFNSIVNSLDLNKRSSKIMTGVIGNPETGSDGKPLYLPFPPEDWRNAVYVRIVQKCGDREYWDKWANDMAAIAQAHTTRLKSLLNKNNPDVKNAFDDYLKGLHENINSSVTDDEALDMLSQHLITKPVFDAIFKQFSAQNPVSKTMEEILKKLEECGLDNETDALKNFYESVKGRIKIIDNDAGRQKVIKDLYERFFQTAFPLTANRLGIVYTPNEVVDFILRSADWALRHELNCPDGLSCKNVHILDPFTGTGTFIVRLIQLGLIAPEVLEYKYTHEIHANEILLLAYYIAAVNIEAAYHEAQKQADLDAPFTPFPGIVLTDTFNLYDSGERQLDITFPENSARANEQRKTPITVIIGNPPYSVGQKSANDNNKNLAYPVLDNAITNTYAEKSKATNKNSLYDSYIRALRWASDRIQGRGVICYVTNGSFLDSNSADGLRKCLYEEFSSIYVFNLRGNAYLQGEMRRKESGNVFGSGSRLPVAVTLLIKNPDKKDNGCELYYRDIGDYLTRDEKLGLIEYASSFGVMLMNGRLNKLMPNNAGDWLNQRSDIFESFIRLGNKKEPEHFAIFEDRYSTGLTTGRDAWCYNFSRDALKANITAMIEVYNQERVRWHKRSKSDKDIKSFVTSDKKKISWSRGLYNRASKDEFITFNEEAIRESLYRPFVKEFAYFNKKINEYVYSMPEIFPNAKFENIVIYISGTGASKDFSVLMANRLPNQHLLDTGQCFPLYWYERQEQGSLFDGGITLDGSCTLDG